MSEESFADKFPSLCMEDDVIKCGAAILQDIEKHCKDNQRIREAIEEIKGDIDLNPEISRAEPEVYARNKLAFAVLENLRERLGLGR